MHSHPLHRSNCNLIRDEWPRIINITDTNTYGVDTQFLANSIQYLIIIIRLTHPYVWQSMGKTCSCTYFIKSHISYCKSHENLYQVLQVMHNASERAMKSEVCMIKSIIITIVPSYTGKKYCLLSLTLLLMLHTRNNTDGNKLLILYGIALHYGDGYRSVHDRFRQLIAT